MKIGCPNPEQPIFIYRLSRPNIALHKTSNVMANSMFVKTGWLCKIGMNVK